MGIDPLSLGMGLAGGFATSFFANLSYDRFKSWRLRKKRGAGDYVAVTHSSASGNFEFYVDEKRSSTVTYSSGDVEIKVSFKRDMGADKST